MLAERDVVVRVEFTALGAGKGATPLIVQETEARSLGLSPRPLPPWPACQVRAGALRASCLMLFRW